MKKRLSVLLVPALLAGLAPPSVPGAAQSGVLTVKDSLDRTVLVPAKVKRVIACSGKVVYDLVKRRDEKKAWDVVILRVEQLYPFPHKAFTAELKKFPNAIEVVWCQDEPQNQGAWFFVQHYIHENMLDGQKLGYAGRPASASPAVGYAHLHQEQQKALLDQAFGKLKGFVLSK